MTPGCNHPIFNVLGTIGWSRDESLLLGRMPIHRELQAVRSLVIALRELPRVERECATTLCVQVMAYLEPHQSSRPILMGLHAYHN